MILNSAFGCADDAYYSAFVQPRPQPQLCQYPNLGADEARGQASTSANPQIVSLMSDCSQAVSSQLQMQSQELHLFLDAQNEKLKSKLQEQRRRELAALFQSAKSRAMTMMRQKERILAEARDRATELQDSLARAQLENQEWQRIAMESESTVAGLSDLLIQPRPKNASSSSREREASVCDSSAFHPRLGKTGCKSCGARRSCAVFLPCRHLCSCMACEHLLDACPICQSPKKSSVEVFMV